MYSILFSPFFIFLWGSTKNGCQPFFYCGCFFFPPSFFILFPFFLIWTWCLWFDVHRHLFLLVLFLLCGCDFNQEMEVQKSTCCHSKYVLFHLLATTSLYLSTSMPVFQHLPRLFCFFFFVHGLQTWAEFWFKLILLTIPCVLTSGAPLNLCV